jgi:hypothetical protein
MFFDGGSLAESDHACGVVLALMNLSQHIDAQETEANE